MWSWEENSIIVSRKLALVGSLPFSLDILLNNSHVPNPYRGWSLLLVGTQHCSQFQANLNYFLSFFFFFNMQVVLNWNCNSIWGRLLFTASFRAKHRFPGRSLFRANIFLFSLSFGRQSWGSGLHAASSFPCPVPWRPHTASQSGKPPALASWSGGPWAAARLALPASPALCRAPALLSALYPPVNLAVHLK